MMPELAAIVGRAHVLTDPATVASYAVDWTGRYRGAPVGVVRPGSTEEVAAVVAACRREGIAVVPQGGNTGLVGGGVPLAGEIVLSLRRLAAVGPVDEVAGQLTAGAGASVAAVQRTAAEGGWTYGVDLASRDSATVGGTIATNAGGLRVLRHGDTRAQVVGVEAVLGDGSVVSHLGGLTRDNTGYHFPSLLCGSEGTLAVVTAARLRLVPPAPERVVALLAFPSVDAAVAGAGRLRRTVPTLAAAELFLASGLDLVCEVHRLPHPFDASHPAYLLVEATDADDLGTAVEALDGVAATAVAVDAARCGALWQYREAHTEVIGTLGVAHKLDVSLPVGRLAEFAAVVPTAVAGAAPGARTFLFGHVAEGNLHVNVTGADPDDPRVDDAVLQLVVDMDGSVSAEHGIGAAKRRWLAGNRSPAEIAAFRAIKRALDPDNILNPNVLLP